MQEENKEYIMRKVNVNYNYKVEARTYNGKTYYKLNVPQKQQDGQVIWFKIPVTMPAGTELNDGCKIKIKQAIENLYYASADVKKYNPIYGLYIKEFEVVEEIVQQYAEQLMDSDDDLPF